MPQPDRRPRSSSTRPPLRASDGDREEVVGALREHFRAGRLTEDELAARVGDAYGARTRLQLDALTLDLPARETALPTTRDPRPPPAREVTPVGRGLRASFHIHLVVYLVVNLALIGIWVAAGGGYFWPIWPIIGWGIGVGAHYAPIAADVGTRRRRLSSAGPRLAAPSALLEVAADLALERPNLQSAAAPDGTVTIMFSDIEGSSALNERLGDARWLALLLEHHRILREQIQAHGGYEVKVEGDGFMLAFAGARRAVQCAQAILSAIDAELGSHPDGPVRVRIGLHTGEALKQEDDFYGKAVVLAARIAALARGGEILTSAIVRDMVQSGGDIGFEDECEIELKGLAGTYRIFRVAPPPSPTPSE